MQKNWYIVYTKPKSENKVVKLLAKKKIENFCPMNRRQIRSYRRNRFLYEPLFGSYVFVYVDEENISSLKKIDGVVNFVYWKEKLATISNEEIEIMKEFMNNFKDIKVEKTIVDVFEKVQIINGPIYSVDGNIFASKNKTVKANLPSLGYVMVAKIEEESIFGNHEAALFKDNLHLHF